MELEKSTANVDIGMQLHIAELAIGIGRRTLHVLLRQEPVDAVAVSATRQVIIDARLKRNTLRRELEASRPQATYSGYSWLSYSNNK